MVSRSAGVIPVIKVVFDDEDGFTTSHQSEVPARRLFESVRIVP
jgi:hypothetical protein